jgi:hypothetical protein
MSGCIGKPMFMENCINEYSQSSLEEEKDAASLAAAKAYMAALKEELPKNFWESRPKENFDYYLLYSKEVDESPINIKPLTIVQHNGNDYYVRQKVQNHGVAYNIADQKIYVFTGLSQKKKSGTDQGDVEIVGKVDICNLIILEDPYGPRSHYAIELEMDMLGILVKDQLAVWNQIRYAVFSEEDYMEETPEAEQSYSVIADAVTGKLHTITSLEGKEPEEQRLGTGKGVKVLGRVYCQKVIDIEDEYGPVNPDEIFYNVNIRKFTKRDKAKVSLARKEHCPRKPAINPEIVKQKRVQSGIRLFDNLTL